MDGLEKASEDVILELVKQLKRGVENKVFILGCEKWESQLKELEDFCTLIEEGGVGKDYFKNSREKFQEAEREFFEESQKKRLIYRHGRLKMEQKHDVVIFGNYLTH